MLCRDRGTPAVLLQSELGGWLGSFWGRGGGAAAHLQGDVGLGPDLGGGQFHVGVLAHEVDGDKLLTPGAGEARGAAAGGLLLHHDALGPVLALVLIAGAGLEQDHGRGVLAEEPAEGRGGERGAGREGRQRNKRGDIKLSRSKSCSWRGQPEREVGLLTALPLTGASPLSSLSPRFPIYKIVGLDQSAGPSYQCHWNRL